MSDIYDVGNVYSCTGSDFCADVRECHVNATCYNQDKGYTCQCNEGFQGNGRTCSGQSIGPYCLLLLYECNVYNYIHPLVSLSVPKLLHEQLGSETLGGCDTAVHTTRQFVFNMPHSFVVVHT